MTKYMIAWNPKGSPRGAPGCKVVPHPDVTNWAAPYEMTTGWCYRGFPPADRRDHELWLLNQAMVLMIQGVPLREILDEFAKIDVWRSMRIPNYDSMESCAGIAEGKPPDTVRMPDGREYDQLVRSLR